MSDDAYYATALPHQTTPPLNPDEHFSTWQLVLFQVLIGVVALLGVFGNILVTTVVLTRRRWHHPSNIFIANIAIADLVICLWTLPTMATSINRRGWPLPDWLCALAGFLDNASYVCSAWSLALGSIERFYLVVSPVKHRESMTASVAILFAASIWLFSIILASLPVIGWNEYVYSQLTFTCAINAFKEGVHKYYFMVFLVLVLPGPMLIIVACYSYIFFYITTLPKTDTRMRKYHLRVVIPLVLITGAFIVCSLPTTIIIVTLLIDPDHKAGTLEPLHYNIIHWVLLGDSCLNPMICAFSSAKFRSACREVIDSTFRSVSSYLSYTISKETGVLYKAKHFMCETSSCCYKNVSTFGAAVKKFLTRFICTKHHANSSQNMDDVVIKVTLNNDEIERSQVDPLLYQIPKAAADTPIRPPFEMYTIVGNHQCKSDPSVTLELKLNLPIPPLTISGGIEPATTQMTTLPTSSKDTNPSSKDTNPSRISSHTDSWKRQTPPQSSSESRRPSLPPGGELPQNMMHRRTSVERNALLNQVIIEEVEPILIWCTCGLSRCRCTGPSTSV